MLTIRKINDLQSAGSVTEIRSIKEIKKLRCADNWTIWKLAIENLVCAINEAYEIYIREFNKPILIHVDASLK